MISTNNKGAQSDQSWLVGNRGDAMETAIQLQNLTRDFGSVRALDSLSLEVPSGTIWPLWGHLRRDKTGQDSAV